MNWTNKTVIITGGNKGIGLSTAELFLADGANVAVLDIDENPAMPTDDRFLYLQTDVSDPKQVAATVSAVHDRYRSVDVLVNNAGIQRYGSVTDTSLETWDLVMNINLRSYFICTRQVLPIMQHAGHGVIINVSSVQAFHSQSSVAAYTTAKTAILGLTRSIAVDYAPTIRCIAICPGTIDTPMLREAINESPDPQAVFRECEEMHLLQRVGKPEEVAEMIKFLSEDKAAFMTGQAIRIDGGLGIIIQGSKKNT